MARISDPALGVSRAMARYGWYVGGMWRGFIVEYAVCVLQGWYSLSNDWCVCCIGRDCGLVCSF